MKKKAETKSDSEAFKRFEDFTRRLVAVPKEEIKRREQAEKEKKKKAA
jgi:hypothetical protein